MTPAWNSDESWVPNYLRARRMGATVQAAATFAGVHHCTVYEARRNVPGFREDELEAEDLGSIKIGSDPYPVRYNNWPIARRVYRSREFWCHYCGEPLNPPQKYRHSPNHRKVHLACADTQTLHYDELQHFLYGTELPDA